MDQRNVYKAELHIHTPASKCYKGCKDSNEYTKIIERAYELGLNIIAITDHNSIEGYKTIIQQKVNILNEIKVLENIQDSNEAKQRLKTLEKQAKVFNEILILPGVEFEVNNGIHLLIIFNPAIEISKIQHFLQEGGFDGDAIGSENDVFSNWSIFELYRESLKYDCIVIDAHTDSNKGIYNTIGEGTPRIHAFTDPTLVGVCYKSEKQKNNIKNLLNTPQYARKTPLSFLKSSDSHKIDEIGKDLTFFRLSNLRWEDLKDAFSNPTECIFTTYPKTLDIIKRITKEEECIYIQDCKPENKEILAKSLCGYSNANGGVIFIGAESSDIMLGLELNSNEDFNIYEQYIKDTLSKLSAQPEFKLGVYPLKKGKCIIVLKVIRKEDFIDINNDGVIHYYENGKIVQLSAKRIHSILSQRINDNITMQINNELSSIQKSVLYIDTYIKSLPIVNSYIEKSIQLSTVIKSFTIDDPVKLTKKQVDQLTEKYNDNPNGKSKGNIYYFNNFQKPRLAEAFLRISIPRFNIREIKTGKKSNNIYVIPGGAIFYSEKDICSYNPNGLPLIKLTLESKYPTKFLCAFLKSSFLLWFIKNKYNSLDIYNPKILRNLLIPNLHLHNPKEKGIIERVESLFDEILTMEKEFLSTDLQKITNNTIEEFIIEYNNKVQAHFLEIDMQIFSLLNLNSEEINIIKENLHSSNIFIPLT